MPDGLQAVGPGSGWVEGRVAKSPSSAFGTFSRKREKERHQVSTTPISSSAFFINSRAASLSFSWSSA